MSWLFKSNVISYIKSHSNTPINGKLKAKN